MKKIPIGFINYKKIVLIAQTPPPYYGQSIMQKYLVDAKWDWCNKKHIKMDFSASINSVGKFNPYKIMRLIAIDIKIILEAIKGPIALIYYPPASPDKVPFYRDVFILPFVRLFSKKIIFHFHSGGFNLLNEKLSTIEKKFANIIYRNPDLAIALLPSLEKELNWIKPKNIISIPNGIEDICPLNYEKKTKPDRGKINVIFVGNIKEEKGILDLIKAVSLIKNIELNIIGGWHNENIKKDCFYLIENNEVKNRISFTGIKIGLEKWSYFYDADIFCLPTFETEALPITLLEAMMFSLPIITTNWRSIPDIIEDGEEGYLVPINSPEDIAEKMKLLSDDPKLRIKMGKKGREKFLREYTIERHLSYMEKAFKELITSDE